MAEIVEIPNVGLEKLESPYAPPKSIIATLNRYRERTPPQQLTPALMEHIGGSKGNTHRILAALEFLGFLDAKNHPTPDLLKLRSLTEEEYKELLSERVRVAYAKLFETFGEDVSGEPANLIRDHFKRYDPPSQTGRQYIFFSAVAAEAGIIPRHQPLPRQPTTSTGKPRQHQQPTAQQQPQQPQARVQQDGPLTEEATRLRLVEALVEKVRETDAGDTDKVQWYLDQIKELGRKEEPRERSE